uniref:DUF229 domain containing protein n=1 Tax=Haemonchus contortus TaxID=6289 RepID=A0A912MTU6_HAECO
MRFRRTKGFVIALVCALAVIALIGTAQLSSFCASHIGLTEPAREKRQGLADDVDSIRNRILFHPFNNWCKFPLPNAYASDIVRWHVSERMRQLKCPYEDFDMATMDSEGYMYVHPHFTRYPNITNDVKCKVVFIEGGLRNNVTNEGSTKITEVATVEAPENTRFYANADAFYIRCYQKDKQIFEKAFAGMRDLNKQKNKIYISEDIESFEHFGGKRKRPPIIDKPKRFSIDILAFDSTSRTMFMRHMPRTVDLMDKLGYEILYGYNKIGDNSMVNLLPILVGDIPEALAEPVKDSSGDVNTQWILPTTKKLDPSQLSFLWKIMQEKFGCRTMFNDDIADLSRGLFHYPGNEFKPGFTSQPADHYYRAYYIAIYKKWVYTVCKDGDQIQKEFVDLWRRFAHRYKNICHFGFTFISSLTHEAGLTLETLDEYLRSSLENLQISGTLDNTVSIIMGDHGNRIGAVKYSYTGTIEERMPLMAIKLPTDFEKFYPNEYANFLENKWKLTSNFDIHQTLRDIVLMRFGTERTSGTASTGRGISLFDKIPSKRSCRDAYIAENFCTCLVDRHNSTKVKDRSSANKKYEAAISKWIQKNSLDACFDHTNVTIVGDVKILGINPLVRHGLRTKENMTIVEEVKRKDPKMDFLYHELLASVGMPNGDHPEFQFRIEEELSKGEFRVAFEPSVRSPPSNCAGLSIFDICACVSS